MTHGEKLSEVLQKRNNELIKLYEKKGAGEDIELQYIPTGLPSLDSRGLLEKGILTIIGGDPGSGKTAWALQLLKAAAEYGYEPRGYFYEDPLKLLSDRITSASIGESAYSLRRLELGPGISERLRAVYTKENWTEFVTVSDVQTDSATLLEELDKKCTEDTGLVIIDYAQAFDAEDNEKSVERVIARIAWGLNQLAKKKNIAIVLFSQLKTEVRERGKKYFDNWRWKNERDPQPSDYDAVEGYRPLSGDLQWSSALYQRAKQILYIFRPGAWLRAHGVAAKDDIVQAMIDKGNYGPNKEIVEFNWNGSLTKISEKKSKKNAR